MKTRNRRYSTAMKNEPLPEQSLFEDEETIVLGEEPKKKGS